MSDEAGNYAIYAVSEPPYRPKGLLRRLIWPNGNPHSFLMLVEENPDGEKKPLAELHFSGKDDDGKFVNAGSKLFNMLAGVADMFRLEKSYMAVAATTGLDKRVYPIKAVKTSPRGHIDRLVKFGSVNGTREHIMHRWNRICAAAVIINRANIPFTAKASSQRGPVNCNAGTKTLLRILGDEFAAVSAAFGKRKGCDLTKEIPALERLRLLTPREVINVPFEALERAQQKLSKRLYETSRLMPRQQAPAPEFKPV